MARRCCHLPAWPIEHHGPHLCLQWRRSPQDRVVARHGQQGHAGAVGRIWLAHGQNQPSRHQSSDYDSVDMGNGELVILDSGTVLPCFPIIYKV